MEKATNNQGKFRARAQIQSRKYPVAKVQMIVHSTPEVTLKRGMDGLVSDLAALERKDLILEGVSIPSSSKLPTGISVEIRYIYPAEAAIEELRRELQEDPGNLKILTEIEELESKRGKPVKQLRFLSTKPRRNRLLDPPQKTAPSEPTSFFPVVEEEESDSYSNNSYRTVPRNTRNVSPRARFGSKY